MKSSSKSTHGDDFILVGRITAAHGIRGAVKVQVFSDSPDIYGEGEPIHLSLPDGSERILTIVWAAPHGRGLRLGLSAVNDRNGAESLIGASLFYEKARLPLLEDDTYYWFELVGLTVVDTAGRPLGRLDSIIPTAGHDVYVIRDEQAGAPRETLVPAIDRVVVAVDLESGTMVVKLPDGL